MAPFKLITASSKDREERQGFPGDNVMFTFRFASAFALLVLVGACGSPPSQTSAARPTPIAAQSPVPSPSSIASPSPIATPSPIRSVGPLTWAAPVRVDRPLPLAGNRLEGVSCPSSGLCVASDQLGNVVISSNPIAGPATWAVIHVDSSIDQYSNATNLSVVSCPSTDLCVAADHSGNVVTSINPAGATPAWTLSKVDGTNQLVSLSCPSSKLCVAGDTYGNVVTSTNPSGGASAWTVTHTGGNGLFGLSCPSSNLCVAVDNQGNVVTSTSPTGGSAAWNVTSIAGFSGGTGVSCPTSILCVAVDSIGDVITSIDPTGGASAWTLTHVDGSNCVPNPGGVPQCLLNGVTCLSSGACVAVDYVGNAVTSTNPTGGKAAWKVTNVDGSNELTAVSCPSIDLCVAVDANGRVVTGTRLAS
jgi:hypothetical protein